MYTVTQAQLVDVFAHLREDREGLTAAAIVCEAAAGLTPDHEPEERVFALLRNTLRELDRGITGRAVQAPLVLGALVKLLYEAGYLPVLEHCASCGSGERALGFSAARGGLVCADCVAEAVPITPEAIEALADAVARPLAELREQPASPAAGEALRDVHQLYAYHTGSRLRALRIAGGV